MDTPLRKGGGKVPFRYVIVVRDVIREWRPARRPLHAKEYTCRPCRADCGRKLLADFGLPSPKSINTFRSSIAARSEILKTNRPAPFVRLGRHLSRRHYFALLT